MHILTLCGSATQLETLSALVKADGLTELTLVCSRPIVLSSERVKINPVVYAPHQQINLLRAAWGTIQQHPPDVIYSMFPDVFSAWFFSRLYRKPCVVSLPAPQALNPFLRWMLTQVALVTVPDRLSGENLLAEVAIKPENVMILPPQRDLSAYTSAPALPRDFEGLALVDGDPHALIDTWWHVVAKHPQARLVMIGALSPELDGLTARLGLRDHILFVDHRQDLPQWIQRSRFFLHLADSPSSVLVEAMAGGAVPIHIEVTGILDVIQDQVNGVLVAYPPNTRQVAKQLTDLIEKPDRYQALQAEARQIDRHFSLAGVTEAWTAILETLAMQKRVSMPD